MSARPAGSTPHPEAGTVTGIWRKLIRWLLYSFVWLVLRVRVKGMDNIPPDGTGVLIVANHLHNADPVLIEIISPRPVHFMAKEELYRFKPLGWLISKFGNFPVARGQSDRKAVRGAINRLNHGIAVGLFPEGTRSRTMRLAQGRTGAGFIAIQGKCPILPLGITGTERLPFNGRRPAHDMPEPGHRGVHIRIGEAFTLPETGPSGKRLSAAQATDMMMHAIAELLPPDHRGVYASPDASLSPSAAEDGGASASSASSAARTN